MNAHLGKTGRGHDIDIERTRDGLRLLYYGHLMYDVHHTILWQPGDHVVMNTADSQRATGTVKLVDAAFKVVVIEVDP